MTVAEVDQQLEEAKKVAANIEAEKQRHREAIQNALTVLEQHALAAKAGDTAAQNKVKRAQADHQAAELELKTCDYALLAAQRQIESLHELRAAAYREERAAEFDSLAAETLATARWLDNSIAGLATFLQEHTGQLRKLTGLSADAHDVPRVFALKHFVRTMHARLHATLPGEFSSYKYYRNKSYETFLREQIENTGAQVPNDDEPEVKSA